MPVLFRIICAGFICCLLACNNSATKKDVSSSVKGAALPADSMSREALFVFIDDCVTNATPTHGQEKAFALCKCIYEQLRKDNQGIDSTQMQALTRDTAQVAKMVANCK